MLFRSTHQISICLSGSTLKALLTRSLPGTPGPDFPSGVGESQHIGRLTPDFVMQNTSLEGQQAMGLAKFPTNRRGIPDGEHKMLERANEILGFA